MTEKGRNRAEIVYEDNSSSCPLLVVIHSISVSADWFSATGKALSSENRLLLEVPEYITFKDGEVLSNEDGSFIFILNIHGKYLTSFYASLAARTGLNISDNLAACNNKIERYRLATDSEKPPEGEEVLAYHPSWIDEDFNPRGIRIGFWNGGDDFKSAHWWDYQDCYITISHCDCDDNSLFSDRIKNSIEPELWISLDVITNYLRQKKSNRKKLQSGEKI